jgi:hypothetical protein
MIPIPFNYDRDWERWHWQTVGNVTYEWHLYHPINLEGACMILVRKYEHRDSEEEIRSAFEPV